jgi:hypothetical protein
MWKMTVNGVELPKFIRLDGISIAIDNIAGVSYGVYDCHDGCKSLIPGMINITLKTGKNITLEGERAKRFEKWHSTYTLEI